MPNHQPNFASNLTDSALEAAILLTLHRFDPPVVPWLRAFFGEIRRLDRPVLILHMSCPDSRALTAETEEALALLRRDAHEDSLRLWSGGWRGVPAALLTRDELEWEFRWSETNEDRTGLEQLFRRKPEANFPARATPAQIMHLAHATGRPVCAGYAAPPSPGTLERLWMYRGGQWSSIPARVINAADPPASPRDNPEEPGLIHLLLLPGPLPEPTRLVEQLRPPAQPVGIPTETGTVELPPVFAEPRSFGSPLLLTLGPAVASPLRAAAQLNRDRIKTVLTALSPYSDPWPGEPVGSSLLSTALREYRAPDEFQGSTEGNLMMSEGTLTVRFVAGRLAGISDERDGSTPVRRFTGYIREVDKLIPRTAFLQTEHAAWFSGARFRGVEEQALLVPPGGRRDEGFELHTRTILTENFPGVLLSYSLRLPRKPPERHLAISLMQIHLGRVASSRGVALEMLDEPSSLSPFPLPPEGAGRTIVTRLARFPLGDGGSLWIGSADATQSTPVAMCVELCGEAGQQGGSKGPGGPALSVDPLFRYEGILPPATAGTLITGTLIIAPGSAAPEALRIPADAMDYVRSFSRTLPA